MMKIMKNDYVSHEYVITDELSINGGFEVYRKYENNTNYVAYSGTYEECVRFVEEDR